MNKLILHVNTNDIKTDYSQCIIQTSVNTLLILSDPISIRLNRRLMLWYRRRSQIFKKNHTPKERLAILDNSLTTVEPRNSGHFLKYCLNSYSRYFN